MEWSFDDKLKCAEIAKNGDWLLGSVRKGSNDPKEFWEPSNLWCFCVHVDGKYTIERYRAMELIDEHGLEEPANDLARPIAEAAFRLDYLLDDEERSVRKGSNDPKEFWEPSNLWCFCVHVDGKYTIERYRAMELIDEHGLEEPANDLARPIAEAAFRLDYLLDDEERLRTGGTAQTLGQLCGVAAA